MFVIIDVGGVPAVSSGGDGFGGGGAIWAIVLIALLGFNRNRGDDGFSANAELNGRFNSIENQIDNLGNREDLARNLMETCETNMNVSQTGAGITREILESKFDNAIIAKDAQIQALECYEKVA